MARCVISSVVCVLVTFSASPCSAHHFRLNSCCAGRAQASEQYFCPLRVGKKYCARHSGFEHNAVLTRRRYRRAISNGVGVGRYVTLPGSSQDGTDKVALCAHFWCAAQYRGYRAWPTFCFKFYWNCSQSVWAIPGGGPSPRVSVIVVLEIASHFQQLGSFNKSLPYDTH